MTTSPDRVLRGTSATGLPTARLDTDLRSQRARSGGRTEGWLADPTLQQAFDEVAAEARAAARAEGYAIGWAQGRRDATEQVRAAASAADTARHEAAVSQAGATRTALRALSQAAADLEVRAMTPAEELRDALLLAAVDVAEALIDRELALATDPGLEALRRALDLVPNGRPVTARLHPSDASTVHETLAAMPAGELGREIVVAADPSVEPGGCVVECDATRVDAQIGTALRRLRQVLAA
jgi:flagellar assembly protein FliH